MTRTQLKTVSIAADPAQLSKGQKAFNSLIKQIEKKRALLAAWEAAISSYQQKYTGELLPLVESSVDLQIEMVHCLDRACDQKGLTKTERRRLAELIVELAGSIVAEAKMREARAQSDAERQAREERRAKRKKSAKQLAREAQQQAEAEHVSRSIREVYRKLASALHPDRENDPQERQRKTALMQRANDAYARNNLLQLLELQLELEHIDQTALDNMSEERLKHYNKVLKEQLAELDQETVEVQGRFRAQFNFAPFARLAPATLLGVLERDIAGVRQGIDEMKRDMAAFDDVKKLKAWLKDMRRKARQQALDDPPWLADMPGFDDPHWSDDMPF